MAWKPKKNNKIDKWIEKEKKEGCKTKTLKLKNISTGLEDFKFELGEGLEKVNKYQNPKHINDISFLYTHSGFVSKIVKRFNLIDHRVLLFVDFEEINHQVSNLPIEVRQAEFYRKVKNEIELLIDNNHYQYWTIYGIKHFGLQGV